MNRIIEKLAFMFGLTRFVVLHDQRAKIDKGGGGKFHVGDRVRAVDHRRVDDMGGRGTVVSEREWNQYLERYTLKVEFDSMPGSHFSMAACELDFLSSEQIGG